MVFLKKSRVKSRPLSDFELSISRDERVVSGRLPTLKISLKLQTIIKHCPPKVWVVTRVSDQRLFFSHIFSIFSFFRAVGTPKLYRPLSNGFCSHRSRHVWAHVVRFCRENSFDGERTDERLSLRGCRKKYPGVETVEGLLKKKSINWKQQEKSPLPRGPVHHAPSPFDGLKNVTRPQIV